ncbi:MAG: glycosyltransferase family 39 protein [Rhodospirillum sp.]|nr:glycosyltransferase family 39 protein [Rhodospirillum sp.]MCF8491095.1 glycosyltransferase family 39 protein [Rhodospirillum sp.]MCF8501962.1 glycosyltransferase family 39 protein [Rhodospirillum sp.]
MSILTLSLCLAALGVARRWSLAALALAPVVLYAEIQAITLAGGPSFRILAWVNGGLLLALLACPTRRTALADWGRTLWTGLMDARLGLAGLPWPARAVLVALSVLVVGKALLFALPHVKDPYHLAKVFNPLTLGDIRLVPAIDQKINVFPGLVEAVLADLYTTLDRGFGLGGVAFGLFQIATFGLHVGVLAALARRHDPEGRAWSLWFTLMVTPVFFHQSLFIQNDYAAMALSAFTLWILARPEARLSIPDLLLAGALAGSAFSLKATTFPVFLVAGLVLPWRSPNRAIIARLWFGLGVLPPVLVGGWAYHVPRNIDVFGTPTGPMAFTGNMHTSLGSLALGLGRLAISLFDLGRVTPVLWPGRGHSGATYSLILPGLFLLWALSGRENRRRTGRLVGGGLLFILAFACVYPDADVAHRASMTGALLVGLGAALAYSNQDTPAPQGDSQGDPRGNFRGISRGGRRLFARSLATLSAVLALVIAIRITLRTEFWPNALAPVTAVVDRLNPFGRDGRDRRPAGRPAPFAGCQDSGAWCPRKLDPHGRASLDPGRDQGTRWPARRRLAPCPRWHSGCLCVQRRLPGPG